MGLLERILKPKRKRDLPSTSDRLVQLVQDTDDEIKKRRQQEYQRILAEEKAQQLRRAEREHLEEATFLSKMKPFREHLERGGVPGMVNDFKSAIARGGDSPRTSEEVILFDENELLKVGGPASFYSRSDNTYIYPIYYQYRGKWKEIPKRETVVRANKEPIKGLGYIVYWGHTMDTVQGDEFTQSYSSDKFNSSLGVFSVRDETGRQQLQIVNKGKILRPSGREEAIDTLADAYRQSKGLK